MPGFPTDGFLLDVSAAGAALAGSLLLGTIAARILRAVLSGRRARAEQAIRPMVLAVVSGGEAPAALISARGVRGRAAERIAFAYLAQVRGEAAAGRWPGSSAGRIRPAPTAGRGRPSGSASSPHRRPSAGWRNW